MDKDTMIKKIISIVLRAAFAYALLYLLAASGGLAVFESGSIAIVFAVIASIGIYVCFSVYRVMKEYYKNKRGAPRP